MNEQGVITILVRLMRKKIGTALDLHQTEGHDNAKVNRLLNETLEILDVLR